MTDNDNVPARPDPDSLAAQVELATALEAIRKGVDAKIKSVVEDIRARRDAASAKTEKGRFGSITFAQRAATVTVTDDNGLLDWLDAEAPELVTETAGADFLATLADPAKFETTADREVVETATGEVVPGVRAVVEVTDHDALVEWLDSCGRGEEVEAHPAPEHEKFVQSRLDTLDDDVVDTATGKVVDWAELTPGTAYITRKPDPDMVAEATRAIDSRVSDFTLGLTVAMEAKKFGLDADTSLKAVTDTDEEAGEETPRSRRRSRRREDDDW